MEHQGFIYDNNGKSKGITYYKCAKSNNFFCPGTAKKNVDGSIVELKAHTTHGRSNNDNQNLVKIFRNKLKERAMNENISLKSIYDDESERHPIAAALYPWPTADSTMRTFRRNSLPSLPQSLQELANKFENGELHRFQCCNSDIFQGCVTDSDGKQNLILACRQLIQIVLENNIIEVHADATFKVVPVNMGNQLLSIHCMIGNFSIPIAYALMEAKSRNSYQCVISFMKTNLFPQLVPETIITDYEIALRDTLLSLGTENTRVVGCWFHHNQAVWKKMKAMNHLHTINSNDHALKCLKMLMCLPLLPAHKMEQGFQLIKLFATNHNVQMNDFFNYYQRYWLRSVGTNIVSVNGLPRRTNNNVESFHNSLRCTFSVTHPNLWVFLGELCKLIKNYHRAHSQLANGLQPTRNLKSKYLINSRRIKIASEQLDAGVISVWNFLVKCTYACSSYEQRQRLWALGMGDQNQPDGDNIVNDVNEIDENAEEVVEEETAQHAVNGTPCMICLVTMPGGNTSQFIVIPCGHAWVCGICKDRLNNEYLIRCPMCRADVERFQRIFIN